jgi:hypothetical protein
MAYARKMQGDDEGVDEENAVSTADIRIAVIDMDAPELDTLHKKHYAADIIRILQAKGEMPWTGYKGECEYLSKSMNQPIHTYITPTYTASMGRNSEHRCCQNPCNSRYRASVQANAFDCRPYQPRLLC